MRTMPSRKFIVHGKVQGVWFRESTRLLAVELGLDGHALNLEDGSVEVVASGSTEAMKKLADWLQHGPPMARVERLEQLDYEGQAPDGFTTGRG